MNDNGSFQDGYLEGYRAILGNGCATPTIPNTPSIPVGKTEYQVGLLRGIQDAKKRQHPNK